MTRFFRKGKKRAVEKQTDTSLLCIQSLRQVPNTVPLPLRGRVTLVINCGDKNVAFSLRRRLEICQKQRRSMSLISCQVNGNSLRDASLFFTFSPGCRADDVIKLNAVLKCAYYLSCEVCRCNQQLHFVGVSIKITLKMGVAHCNRVSNT